MTILFYACKAQTNLVFEFVSFTTHNFKTYNFSFVVKDYVRILFFISLIV